MYLYSEGSGISVKISLTWATANRFCFSHHHHRYCEFMMCRITTHYYPHFISMASNLEVMDINKGKCEREITLYKYGEGQEPKRTAEVT